METLIVWFLETKRSFSIKFSLFRIISLASTSESLCFSNFDFELFLSQPMSEIKPNVASLLRNSPKSPTSERHYVFSFEQRTHPDLRPLARTEKTKRSSSRAK